MKEQHSNPLISVIIPVYNTAPYLTKCMSSIVNQTYKELEIICVDDGSTDGSAQILDEFARSDTRIIIIHTENRGVSAARNMALSVASGDLIGFVDSDDYLHREMYQILLGAMEKNDVDFVTCGYYFDDIRSVTKIDNQGIMPTEPLDIKQFLYYMYKRDEFKGVAGYLWTKLFRKELIKGQTGELLVRFSEDLNVGEDVLFMAEICRNTKKVLYIDQALYFYTQRMDSAVHSDITQIQTMSWIHAYERIIKIYKEWNVPENIIDIIVRMYVYRCGKLLEIAITYDDKEKKNILEEKIKKNLLKYVETNIECLDRVYWILRLLCDGE